MAPRLRLVLHALDRTGPPSLAAAFVRWMQRRHPDVAIDVLSLRGGPLAERLMELVDVTTLLDHAEPWYPLPVSQLRVEELSQRVASLGKADTVLLVSVAAGQVLPMMAEDDTPILTWSVERGEDLHWLDRHLGLRSRTTAWLAGSSGTKAELTTRLGRADVALVPEFVGVPERNEVVERRCRALMTGEGEGRLVVVGAGISTYRKAPDLFCEVASRVEEARPGMARFVWIGGERDELWNSVAEDVQRWRLPVTLVPSVADIDLWLRAADVFLHTARLDSFPLVCLSAAGGGTPVIAFEDSGGAREMFGPAFVGAPYPDVAGLARCVVDLVEWDKRTEVAVAQQTRVGTRFTVDVAAPVLFERVMAAGGRRPR